jgi:hypothetical protein
MKSLNASDVERPRKPCCCTVENAAPGGVAPPLVAELSEIECRFLAIGKRGTWAASRWKPQHIALGVLSHTSGSRNNAH